MLEEMLEEASCSDCKLEIIERRWTQLLLKWLNTCITRDDLKELNFDILTDIICKYKEDICQDDLDRTIINSEDVESFIKYKFPILRLRNLYEVKDYPKRLYIMASMLLYYCCTNSLTGTVDGDICNNLDKEEQLLVLKFCEALTEMEATINNVDSAIKVAVCYQSENQDQPIIQTASDSSNHYASFITKHQEIKRRPILQFKSSITVLPSVITEASTSGSICEECSDSCALRNQLEQEEKEVIMPPVSQAIDTEVQGIQKNDSNESVQMGDNKQPESNLINQYQNYQEPSDYICTGCNEDKTRCSGPGCSKEIYYVPNKDAKTQKSRRWMWMLCGFISSIFLLLLILVLATMPVWRSKYIQSLNIEEFPAEESYSSGSETVPPVPEWVWQCRKKICHKVLRHPLNISFYTSLSRCTLLCMGPQLWPYPIGYTYFSQTIIAVATNKLEYKFLSIPSDSVRQYLAEAFMLFLKDLARLEKIDTKPSNPVPDLTVGKMIIQINIESDPDPRLRVNTDEGYIIKVESNHSEVFIKVSGVSFCGVRHGFETLSQLILLDQSTGHLITLSNVLIKDTPSYKYRGVMIDTGRNYIPVIDLIKTVDAMATCKLNTFHWRISDVTSFPLNLMNLPQFVEAGPYDRLMVYTKKDIKSIVKRAGIRGIRVLIEVAAPGPIGRPWSWLSATTCPKKNQNFTCDNILCMRLLMEDVVFDILQIIYSEIIEMTNVDDIFHLSDGVFSMTNCYYLMKDREGFLDKALVRLKMANKGFLPKLPIIWYTTHLLRDFEAKSWDRLGVQLNDWEPNPIASYLSKFRVIQSTRWDLSCDIRKQRCTKYRSWQQMYAWKSWKNLDVFTLEGGESILWTDLVDSSNLEYHLWPRAAAVAERLWSDVAAGASADRHVYMRLDSHRWRMLLRGVRVQPIFPAWCSFNPSFCLDAI